MGSFLERHDCSDTEQICYQAIDIIEKLIPYAEDLEDEEYGKLCKQVNLLKRLTKEEDSLKWEDCEEYFD